MSNNSTVNHITPEPISIDLESQNCPFRSAADGIQKLKLYNKSSMAQKIPTLDPDITIKLLFPF